MVVEGIGYSEGGRKERNGGRRNRIIARGRKGRNGGRRNINLVRGRQGRNGGRIGRSVGEEREWW